VIIRITKQELTAVNVSCAVLGIVLQAVWAAGLPETTRENVNCACASPADTFAVQQNLMLKFVESKLPKLGKT
jgi:hypothetical protein